MSQLLIILGFGIVSAAILALSAVAFTLEYAVTDIANLAHGELLTVGAYAAYVVLHITGNVFLSALAAAGAGGILALAMQVLVIERFVRNRAGTLTTFIATVGLAFIIENILVIFFGAANVAYTIPQSAPIHVGPFLWTSTEIEIILSALAITVALYVIITYTKFGKALRAVFQNRELARVTGINSRFVAAATWFLAGLVAGYAGFILAESVGTFTPYFGFSFFLITLTAAVAGGLGKPFSTMIGAVIVGLALVFAADYINSSYNLAFAFAMLTIVILVRPRGLFTKQGRNMFE
jgi:branched-chain amino acid transport system permease protein/neutral amino acid transport system permease protein